MDIYCCNNDWVKYKDNHDESVYVPMVELVELIEAAIKKILGIEDKKLGYKMFEEDNFKNFVESIVRKNGDKIIYFSLAAMAELGNVTSNEICKILVWVNYFDDDPKSYSSWELSQIIDAIGRYRNTNEWLKYYLRLKDLITSNKHSQSELKRLFIYSERFSDKDDSAFIGTMLIDEFLRPQLLKISLTRHVWKFRDNLRKNYYGSIFANFREKETEQRVLLLNRSKYGYFLEEESNGVLSIKSEFNSKYFSIDEIYHMFDFAELEYFIFQEYHAITNVGYRLLMREFAVRYIQIHGDDPLRDSEISPNNNLNIFEYYAKLFIIFKFMESSFETDCEILCETRQTLVDFIIRLIDFDNSLANLFDFSSYYKLGGLYFGQTFVRIISDDKIEEKLTGLVKNFDLIQTKEAMSVFMDSELFRLLFEMLVDQFLDFVPSSEDVGSVGKTISDERNKKYYYTALLANAEIPII